MLFIKIQKKPKLSFRLSCLITGYKPMIRSLPSLRIGSYQFCTFGDQQS